jgi:hypothetical protein
MLDRNRDNQLSGDEWGRSRTVRPMFEKAGIDMSRSMPKEEFIQNYLRASANTGR